MITINWEQPILQKDMDEFVKLERENVSRAYSRIFKVGVVCFLVGLAVIYYFGLKLDKISDPYGLKFISFLFWICISGSFILVPLTIKSRMVELIEFPYQKASKYKAHNCKAFLNMPGMEKHKEYADKVVKQGRDLINLECDEIINYWQSLAQK